MKPRSPHVATLLAMALVSGAIALGCGSDEEAQPPPETAAAARLIPPPPPQAPRPQAVISVEGFGEIRLEMIPEVAPKTVENFIKLAKEEFYDGTTFHRVIPEFMIQGGDPNSKNRDPRDDGKGGPGYTIEDEFSEVSHTRGMVSMANTGKPKSGGSQFFVLVKDTPRLDGKYALFGRVLEGMKVADRIAAVERDIYGRHGPRDRPVENVVMTSIRIEPTDPAAVPDPRPPAEAPTSTSDWDEGPPGS
jgi:cyclophilin family peptidyl-prolyl cis-trans isomerase